MIVETGRNPEVIPVKSNGQTDGSNPDLKRSNGEKEIANANVGETPTERLKKPTPSEVHSFRYFLIAVFYFY